MEKEIEEKFVVPSIDELNEFNKKDSYVNVNTMARKKLKRKVHLYDVATRTEDPRVLDFDDLRPGDNFTLYEYDGIEVLNNGFKVMRVASIQHKIDGSIVLDVLPVYIQLFNPILN